MLNKLIRAIQVAWYKRKVARRLERAKFGAMRDEMPIPQPVYEVYAPYKRPSGVGQQTKVCSRCNCIYDAFLLHLCPKVIDGIHLDGVNAIPQKEDEWADIIEKKQ